MYRREYILYFSVDTLPPILVPEAASLLLNKMEKVLSLGPEGKLHHTDHICTAKLYFYHPPLKDNGLPYAP